jgi:hypothetical protein
VEHQRAYADRVALVGTPANLRQLFVKRGFTCTFSPAEIVVALDLLERRVESGDWGDTRPETLNAEVERYPAEQRRVFNFTTPIDAADRYEVQPAAFAGYRPASLPRTFPF